ncbi:laccase, multicopper oxidase, benzenediol:oxygen oxidorectuctase [Marasmius tenuissimus]|uniref:Laccase, multicopper oxidase, benzenediol:oxygen oxidorectuctase n=1 Tax=Marasmius tenuissimus TaxID=585030 RepID=A0ABR2ZG27_9AGAR
MARLQSLLSFVLLAVLGANGAHIGPAADLVISNGVAQSLSETRANHCRVNVVNQLNDPTMLQSTSIHWHGFFQEHTNWADGPAFVNQCPIPKGTSFLYDFPIREQAGTFWYHSHLSTQYCDGLRGVVVVHDPQDPHAHLYDVDDDSTVITLADWYHAKAKTLVDPTPDTTLINGLGRHKGGAPTDLAIIQVQQGNRYRMRLANVACQPDYLFSIDNHAMTIIEADSINHEPLEVDSLRIFVGQRYSFVLNADQPVGNYWVRADPSDGDGGFNGGINSAILRYVGAPEAEPAEDLAAANKSDGREMNEADLHPLENPGAPGLPFPGGVDHAINLHLSTSGDKFAFNGVSYESPSLPVLLQVLSGARDPGSLLPEGSVYELPANATIEVSFTGGGVKGFEHPIHLHGHAFDVVRVAGSDECQPGSPRCCKQCGLAVVFAERTTEWKNNISPPAAWDELCPEYAAMDPADL